LSIHLYVLVQKGGSREPSYSRRCSQEDTEYSLYYMSTGLAQQRRNAKVILTGLFKLPFTIHV